MYQCCDNIIVLILIVVISSITRIFMIKTGSIDLKEQFLEKKLYWSDVAPRSFKQHFFHFLLLILPQISLHFSSV